MRLHELQRSFMRAVTSRDRSPIESYLSDIDGLNVHRNNIIVTCRETLQAIYPVIERLVGLEFFRYMAEKYIEGHTSTDGDLNLYGGQFADFLSPFHPVGHLPYLPDVARLEWCCHVTYLAADDAPLDVNRLAEYPADRYGDIRFQLSQSCGLLCSEWPIDRIWHVNQDNFIGDQSVDLSYGGVKLLIRRSGADLLLHQLDAAEWTFLKSVHHGAALGDALTEIQKVAAVVDHGALIHKFISSGCLVDISPPYPDLRETRSKMTPGNITAGTVTQ